MGDCKEASADPATGVWVAPWHWQAPQSVPTALLLPLYHCMAGVRSMQEEGLLSHTLFVAWGAVHAVFNIHTA